MSASRTRRRIELSGLRTAVGIVVAVLFVSGFLCPADVSAEETPVSSVQPGSEAEAGTRIAITGSWSGAKLKCRKEQGKAVRCGKPEPFDVNFKEDGTGESVDDKFPKNFTYSWTSSTEITIQPVPEGKELKIFQIEKEEEFLTFHAYLYMPAEDTGQPAELNYIHYIFDVSRRD